VNFRIKNKIVNIKIANIRTENIRIEKIKVVREKYVLFVKKKNVDQRSIQKMNAKMQNENSKIVLSIR
jgi:hypothetical protein